MDIDHYIPWKTPWFLVNDLLKSPLFRQRNL
nr:hypothetical protein [Pantoea ananatis]